MTNDEWKMVASSSNATQPSKTEVCATNDEVTHLCRSNLVNAQLCGVVGSITGEVAPGAPGNDAHWPGAAKVGFGTSNTVRSKVWFTLTEES